MATAQGAPWPVNGKCFRVEKSVGTPAVNRVIVSIS